MKKLTKLFAVFSTAAVIASGCFATVSADTPPEGYDINGDGVVNIADVVLINSLLNGEWRTANLSDVDVNNNGIVDYADRACIINYVSSGIVPTIVMF